MMLVQTSQLDRLLEKLDDYGQTVPQELAESWLRETDLRPEDVAEHVSFKPDLYQRGTVKKTGDYELLVVSWGPGQWSTLHDHFGSICAFRIVSGKATEIHFERSSGGYIFPAETAIHTEGSVQSCSGAEIHQLCNLESQGLVSVHIYSPPLASGQTYSIEESPFGGYAELARRVAARSAHAAALEGGSGSADRTAVS